MVYSEKISQISAKSNCEYGRFLCQILYSASIVSYVAYVTETCLVTRDGYRVMWLTFTEAGDQLFRVVCSGSPMHDAVERLMKIILDAYLLDQGAIDPSSLERIWRTRPPSSALDGVIVYRSTRHVA